MRISDCSSDVCSSDLVAGLELVQRVPAVAQYQHSGVGAEVMAEARVYFGQAQPTPAECLPQSVEAAFLRVFTASGHWRDTRDFHLHARIADAGETAATVMAAVGHHHITVPLPHQPPRHPLGLDRPLFTTRHESVRE